MDLEEDVTDILDTIGTVLDDWDASADAMRWTPGRVICDGGGLTLVSRHDSVLDLRDCGDIVFASGTYDITFDRIVLLDPGEAVLPCTAGLPASADFECSVTEAGMTFIAGLFGFWFHDGTWHWHAEDAPRKTTCRCHGCNPGANPRRTPLNGREYHRRQLARKKRR